MGFRRAESAEAGAGRRQLRFCGAGSALLPVTSRKKVGGPTYLIGFADDPDSAQVKLPSVEGHARWYKNGKRYPEWIDKEDECWVVS